MDVQRWAWPAGIAALLTLGFFSLRNGSPQAPPGAVPIRYMAWGNPQQLALEQKMVDLFNRENPDVHVRLFQVPQSAYGNKMLVMLASRTAPEILRVDHYVFPSLVRKGFFRPLDDLIAKDFSFRKEEFFPQGIEEGTFEGKFYGMNVLFGGVVIYYNKTLVKKAGLEDPFELWQRGEWTWERFRAYAIAMTSRDQNGRYLTFGAAIPPFPNYLSTVWGFGGEIMDDKWERVTLAEGKAVDAFRFWRDLRFKDKAAPTPAQSANSAFSFESGKMGMIFEWMGLTPRLREAALNFEWDVVPIPSGPRSSSTIVKGNQLVMSAETKNPGAAWRFMRFLTSERIERLLSIERRRAFPARKTVAYSNEYLTPQEAPRNALAFVKSVEGGRPLPITSRWGDWTGHFNSEIDVLWMNPDENVEEVLRRGQDRANRALQTPEGL